MNYKTTKILKDENFKKQHGYKKIQLVDMLEITQFGIEYKCFTKNGYKNLWIFTAVMPPRGSLQREKCQRQSIKIQ